MLTSARCAQSNNRFTLPGILPVVSAASTHPAMRALLVGRFSIPSARSDQAQSASTTSIPILDEIFATLQSSAALSLVELHTTPNAADTARRVAAINAALQARNGVLSTQERSLRAHHAEELHTQRCRFRALVRMEAERVITQLCQRMHRACRT